jgi:hypothetical protein
MEQDIAIYLTKAMESLLTAETVVLPLDMRNVG